MRLSQFILLDEEGKKFKLLHNGILVGKRLSGQKVIFLFQLESFYIEVYCNPLGKNIEEYHAFHGTAPLQPYLEAIQIDHLFHHE